MNYDILWGELQQSFATHYSLRHAQRTKLHLKILKLRAQLEKAEKAINAFDNLPTLWITLLLKPLIELIVQELPGWHLDPDDFKPRRHFADGRFTVFLYKNMALPGVEKLADDNCIYISCLPGDLATGEVFYCATYPADVTPVGPSWQPLQTIAQAVGYLRQQIDQLPNKDADIGNG